jgi:hypothetical protein
MNTPELFPVYLLAAALLGLTGAASAQDASVTATGPQVYQVEIIVLRFTNPGRTRPEARLAPDTKTASPPPGNTSPANPGPASFAAQEPDGTLRWLPADTATQRLGNASRRACTPNFCQVLAYRSWLQPAPDERSAYSLNLADLDIDTNTVSGRIKFYQKQSLYLTAEIRLNGANTPAGQAVSGIRKMPLGKTVYFDDPQIGLIALVTRSDASWPDN